MNKNVLENTTSSNRKAALLLLLKWIILIILVLIAAYIVTKPLRVSSAAKYISQGDEYLKNKKYLTAKLSYQKALLLKNDLNTIDKINLTDHASLDITVLEQFYSDANMTEESLKLIEANKVPTNESDAVLASRKLIEAKEYQLAIIPAKTATEMDANYRDAWLYLGIANLECSQKLQINPAAKNHYLEEAKTALNKAKEIDPIYQPTLDYLKALNN